MNHKKLTTVLGMVPLIVVALTVCVFAATSVEFIFDASYSMSDQIEGKPKITIAKETFIDFINKLPDEINAGLRVYGIDPLKGCEDTTLLFPIASLHKEKLILAVREVTVGGMTPLAYSLEQAGKDFENLETDRRFIILLTDGMDTCEENPPAEAAQVLAEAGIKVHVIGFAIGEKEIAQLKQIATAGEGNYYSAKGSSELVESFQQVREELAEEERKENQTEEQEQSEEPATVEEKEKVVDTEKMATGEKIPLNRVSRINGEWKITLTSYVRLETGGIRFNLLLENLQDKPDRCMIDVSDYNTYLLDNVTNEYRGPQISRRGWIEIIPGWPVQISLTFPRLMQEAEAIVLYLYFKNGDEKVYFQPITLR